MKFRKKILLALISASALPLIIYAAVSDVFSAGTAHEIHKNDIDSVARVSASAFSEMMELRKTEIKLISSAEVVLNYINASGKEQIKAAEEKADEYINMCTEIQSVFENIIFADTEGRIVISYDEELIGRSLADEDYYKTLVNVNKNPSNVYVSKIISSQTYPNDPERNCLAFSRKLYNDNGGMRGVIIAYMNTKEISDFFKKISYDSTQFVFITDSENNILYKNAAHYLDLDSVYMNLIPDAEDGVGIIYEENFPVYYIAMNDGFTLFLRDSYVFSRNMMLIAVPVSLILLLSAGFAFYFSKKTSAPVQKLNTVLAENNSDNGKFSACELDSEDEFGTIARNYNDIIGVLLGKIEEIKEQKFQKEYIATHDLITNLPNLYAFENKLGDYISEKRAGGILHIDIDRFKIINDTFGYPLGDELMKKLGQRLQASSGGFDFCARVSGDEFLLLKNGSESDIISAANQVMNDLRDPVLVGEDTFHISVCIGISYYPKEGASVETLIHNANMALCRAKEKGGGEIAFFIQGMRNKLSRYNQLLKVLRGCIENNEIYMVYQPVINKKTQKTVALESLMRIKSEELGELYPNEFIPIAESEPGLINRLGDWALDNVCAFTKQLINNDGFKGTVSINVSVSQIDRHDFVDTILLALQRARLEPRYLRVEVTESVMTGNAESNIEKLCRLKNQGISIAMDDFGVNGSSLNYIMALPLDMIKIDKSFIDNIDNDYRKMLVIEMIIKLAHVLNFRVTAEGVEQKKQFDLLSELDCDFIQGFYFSLPLSEKKARERILNENFLN